MVLVWKFPVYNFYVTILVGFYFLSFWGLYNIGKESTVLSSNNGGWTLPNCSIFSTQNQYRSMSENLETWFHNHIESDLPSRKLTWLWKITIFNGKINYNWPFSIAMLVYQRVIWHHTMVISMVIFLICWFIRFLSSKYLIWYWFRMGFPGHGSW